MYAENPDIEFSLKRIEKLIVEQNEILNKILGCIMESNGYERE